METGIYIRAFVDGRWGSVDIGDTRLPDSTVATWLKDKSSDGDMRFLRRLVMSLLGRDMEAVD